MRRQAHVITEERAENLEQVKKLTKHVHEYIRGADASLSSVGDVAGVFSATALGCRARLRDTCERLILAQPGSQARRIEELLWRKVYYDPLSAAKKMRKGANSGWNFSEGWMVSNHLSDGLAYYHHLMHQLHTNNLTTAAHGTIADFLPCTPLDVRKDAVVSEVNCAESYHRCLTCLGDLARYMLDLPSPPPYTMPARYYLQALHFQREAGLTHSNLATVYSACHQPLLATAHYLRALTCEKTFEGAEGNLKRILDKSRNWFEIQREELENDSKGGQQQQQGTILLHASLTLVSYLLNNRDITEITHLCQEVLMKLGKVLEGTEEGDPELSERSSTPPEDTAAAAITNGAAALSNQEIDSPDDNKNQDKKVPFLMTPNAMVTICVVLIICTKRLRKQGSPHSSLSQALLVSILLTVVTHVVEHIQQRISLVDPSFLTALLPEPEKSDDLEASKNGESSNINTGEKETEEEKENSEGNKKKKKLGRIGRLASIRRKRRGSVDNSGESDESGNSSDESESDEDPEDAEDISSSDGEEEEEEEVDMSQLCSSEDDDDLDDDSDLDVKIESDQEWDGLTAQEHLELIGQEGMMSPVYLICVWLAREDEVIKMCGKMGGSMWKALAKLLNLLRVNLEQLKEGSNIVRSEVAYLFQEEGQKYQNEAKCVALDHTPLQEDLMLYNLLPSFQYGTDQQVLNLKSQELVLLRLHRLQMFGKKMSLRKDTPLWYEPETNTYKVSSKGVIPDESSKEVDFQNDHASNNDQALNNDESIQNVNPHDSSTQSKISSEIANGPSNDSKESSNRLAGMHALTAQWLQHEVRSLEQRTARRATLGLYLVPDTHVLINHLQSIKTLLANPTHMIIIPQVVVDSLDQQKKESLGARDAIRWLEIKFRHGSRFIRAQRPHERTRLPLIKYPKRKDKEAWDWYQMVESCHYLSAQVQYSGKSAKSSTVTLLTGKYQPKNTVDQPANFNPAGVTQAAGAVLEHIEGFMAKWISSTKGHS